MEELLSTYQETQHALYELQDQLDIIDSEQYSKQEITQLIEAGQEALNQFLSFLSLYMEEVHETPLVTTKPSEILSHALEERVITAKEHKILLTRPPFKSAENESQVEKLIEHFAILHDIMKDLLDDIEL